MNQDNDYLLPAENSVEQQQDLAKMEALDSDIEGKSVS